ncbi:MAG: DUF1800 family protein [Phycisphaerae bacterium]
MSLLKPYEPSASRPWDRVSACQLLRRAGFSPSEAEIRDALQAGVATTVDRLIDGDQESDRFKELDELGASLAVRQEIGGLRGWWLSRMVHTQRPLRSRLAVMWHNHFATSNAKVNSPALMLQQLRTIEQHALGKFGDLTLAMARDPAMIVWLDGNENVKGRPNENFARELFELFTLGVGNYSERDIKEAARAFTGWHQRRGSFQFAATDHDTGEKVVLGARGNFDGPDIIRIALAQPAAARFIATKLLREFVSPTPTDALVSAVAEKLCSTDYDIRDTLRAVLRSEAFFAAEHYRARIKSPVEFAIGIARSLELRVPAARLDDVTSQMGQRLFEPPSVKGWDGHRTWLDSATMLIRLNTVGRAASGEFFDAGALRGRYDVEDSTDAIVRFCGELLLDGRVPESIARQGTSSDLRGDDGMRTVVRVLLSCPEYQLA